MYVPHLHVPLVSVLLEHCSHFRLFTCVPVIYGACIYHAVKGEAVFTRCSCYWRLGLIVVVAVGAAVVVVVTGNRVGKDSPSGAYLQHPQASTYS